MLPFYARHFSTVEVNNTYYQLPERETVTHWREQVPQEFTFVVKANRYITHMKKLKDPQEPLANMLSRVAMLGDKLGPILFQLPPHWHFNAGRLQSFLEQLPEDRRAVFEFRDPSWFNEQAYGLLRAHDAAFCMHDHGGRTTPKEITAGFIYIRFHGGSEQGSYSTQTLAGWAGAISTWRQDHDVYCYFNNDWEGYALDNARELCDMLAG
jgi:uncharacterized protein YecE (DUF72 family)